MYSRTDDGVRRVVCVRLEQWEGLATPVAAMQLTDARAPQRVLLAAGGGALFVAFMGTKLAVDVLADANLRAGQVRSSELPSLRGGNDRAGLAAGQAGQAVSDALAAHSGFLGRARVVDPELVLEAALATGATRVVLCGHSLGGAVATLATLRLEAAMEAHSDGGDLARLLGVPRCFAFGAPACCSAALGQRVTATPGLAVRFSNYCTPADIVPYLLSVGAAVAPPRPVEAGSAERRARGFWRLPRLANLGGGALDRFSGGGNGGAADSGSGAASGEGEVAGGELGRRLGGQRGAVDASGSAVSFGLPIFAHFGAQLSIGRSGIAERTLAEERAGRAALSTRRAGKALGSSLLGGFTSHRMPTYQAALAHVCRDAIAEVRKRPKGMHLLAGRCAFEAIAPRPELVRALALAPLPAATSATPLVHVAVRARAGGDQIARHTRLRAFEVGAGGSRAMAEVSAAEAVSVASAGGHEAAAGWQMLALPWTPASRQPSLVRPIPSGSRAREAAPRVAHPTVSLGWRTIFARQQLAVDVLPRRVSVAGLPEGQRAEIAAALCEASGGAVHIVDGGSAAAELLLRAGADTSIGERELWVPEGASAGSVAAETLRALCAGAPRAIAMAAAAATAPLAQPQPTLTDRASAALSWLRSRWQGSREQLASQQA